MDTLYSYWFIIDNESLLFNKNNQLPNHLELATIASDLTRQFKLGQQNGITYFCAEMPAGLKLSDAFHRVPLKKALSYLPSYVYSMGVKAYSIIHWDINHQFCGRCSTMTQHQTKHFERTCPTCHLSFYPRISPSIIVLIYSGDQLIMARSPHFLPGVYGLIAGFVEAGETLEEAVHREVQEEIDVKIKNVSYFGSQPWPFPDSLMIGFMAEYESGNIKIDENEIEEAGWYAYNHLPGRPSTSISIAAKLLDHFIDICQKKAQLRVC